MLFRLPMNGRQHVIGLDLYALPGRRPLIDRAIEGSPQSSGLVPSLATPNAKASVVLFYAPVYRTGGFPAVKNGLTPSQVHADDSGGCGSTRWM